MLQGFIRMIKNLDIDEMLFLGNFIGYDSNGVLIVVCKYIFMKLGMALAAKLIIALYKPGAFFAFYIRAVHEIFPFRTAPHAYGQFVRLYYRDMQRSIRFRPLRN